MLLYVFSTCLPCIILLLSFIFFKLDSIPDMCDELENMDRLREYYRRWKAWVSVRKLILSNLFTLNEYQCIFLHVNASESRLSGAWVYDTLG